MDMVIGIGGRRLGLLRNYQLSSTVTISNSNAMAIRCQDTIVLFGDSLTQMSWNPELGAMGARVAGSSSLYQVLLVIDLSLGRRSVCS